MSFYIPFGGDLVMEDLTTYGSITSVDYKYLDANTNPPSTMCPSGNTRVIWGHSNDPAAVKRLERPASLTAC